MAAPTDVVRRDSRADRRRRPRRGGASGTAQVRGWATLEDRVLALWSQLAPAVPVNCPVCARAQLVADGCGACGSQLS